MQKKMILICSFALSFKVKMNNIPNRIKQPSVCCIYCGKYYQKKSNLQKHVLLCEIYHQGVRGNSIHTNELIEEMSDGRKLYSILQQLVLKCNSMEKQIQELKQKERNVERNVERKAEIETLDSDTPSFEFMDIPSKINIKDSDIDNMVRNELSFYALIESVLHRDLSSLGSVPLPLKLIRKKMVVFDFIDKEEKKGIFVDPTYEKMLYLSNQLHDKVCRSLFKWREKWQGRMDIDSALQDKYDNATLKIMKIDRKKPEVHNKIKKIMENSI
jgi:hypothetical protein